MVRTGRESETNKGTIQAETGLGWLGEAGGGPVSDLMPSLLGAAGSTQEKEGKAWGLSGGRDEDVSRTGGPLWAEADAMIPGEQRVYPVLSDLVSM